MNLAVPLTAPATAITKVDDIKGLAAIRDPGCAAVLWQRRPPAGFQAWIDALDPGLLPGARVILSPEAVPAALAQLCAGMPDCPERAWLIADGAALAAHFAGLMRAPWLRLRLDVVTGNACRRFHIDAVTARLICTYRGTGTQFGVSAAGAEPAQIDTAPTGAPLILRGTLWRERPRAGLLHRSPPIAGTGESRLVLVLDPLDDPDDDT